jgi:hypothetical protein
MPDKETLHERLIALQSDEEIARKWVKAQGRWSNHYWAQEWLDVADRRAKHLFKDLTWVSAGDAR